jgi:hypothetical protein
MSLNDALDQGQADPPARLTPADCGRRATVELEKRLLIFQSDGVALIMDPEFHPLISLDEANRPWRVIRAVF